MTGAAPIGPVKWLKDSGCGRQVVYDQRGSFPRVTRADNDSETNFTIRLSDTRPADAGVYRCVKFRKNVTEPDEEIRSGAGTPVSVRGQSLFSSLALWIGLLLEKVLSAAFLLFLFLRSKE